ncbi:MAG TPA: RluA family pseudouridine synthase [Candidatus Babeliales bacterium]|nr:RluA family pseudouridine synthase [Candidatus Babeliales bacterium]
MIKYGHIEPENIFSFIVPKDIVPCRIDHYITKLFPDYSRSYLQRIITAGCVTVNAISIKKSSTLIYETNTILVQFPPERTIEPATIIDKTINVSIIAITDHFIMIHKPAHLLVHPSSTRNTSITLVDWIQYNYSDISLIGNSVRPGIIHRLDKETSGIMIITRTNYAHNAIGELFRGRHIQKTYKAVVAGHPNKEGTITLAIGRDPINRIKMASFDEEKIDNNGKINNIKVRNAKTHYKVLEYFENTTLIEVKPTTGRTHQIRVHMAAIGHPIIGDQLYGTSSPLINRQALHAESLSFFFNETPYSFSSKIPDDFQQLLINLRTPFMKKNN